ncbi:unnamed protein product [Rhizoctonia solani]|uniref:O-methylsterigmatocystin oxidoreductase n=1 Tax=Rhizoctonia solani TaxID=456999 RepID=A0A8H3B020_9AGAM|nr:unnamed protein product [Rhizoctonia solani]
MFKEPSLLDWSNHVVLLEYGDQWRHHRRMLNNWLNAHAVSQFHCLQEHQVRLMLRRLVNVPGESHPFEEVKDALFYSHRLIRGNVYNQPDFLVNVFPSLKYVPDWFPGTGWKRTAREWRALKESAQSLPYEWTKTQLEAGVTEPSILSMLLQNHRLTSNLTAKEKELRLKELTWIIVAAGTDTTSATLTAFVAAMVLNSHVQTKAQKELDDILGLVSLPTMADQERLPYIRNLIQEVLRWHPVAPIGVPHSCRQDDIYEGYEIERGTIVIGNIWAITRNKVVYKDPEVFDPDRFLDPSVPYAPAFGWGRRKCPGVYFAEASLFITAATLLATFRFSQKKDSNGQEIPPRLEAVSNSIVMELKPFEFELEFRSDKHRQLIPE